MGGGQRRGAKVVASAGLIAVVIVALAGPTVAGAAAPPASWVRAFGAERYDISRSVVVGGDGLLAIGGYTHVGPGASDVDTFLASYTKTGEENWTVPIATNAADYGLEVAATNDAIYVVGRTNGAFVGYTQAGVSDLFVARYDWSGDEVWLRQFGTSSEESEGGIAVVGNVVVATGSTRGAFAGATNAGGSDSVVTAWSTSGAPLWTRQFGTSADEFGPAVVALDANSVAVAGTTLGAFPGETLEGSRDGYVARFSTNGDRTWLDQFGTGAGDTVEAITAQGGALFVAGYTDGQFPGQVSNGSFDGFVSSHSNAGALTWARQLGSGFIDAVLGIAPVAGGGVAVAGWTTGTVGPLPRVGGVDSFSVGLRATGEIDWIHQFGVSSDDVAIDVAGDELGNVFAVGRATSAFAGEAHAGDSDAYVARFGAVLQRIVIRMSAPDAARLDAVSAYLGLTREESLERGVAFLAFLLALDPPSAPTPVDLDPPGSVTGSAVDVDAADLELRAVVEVQFDLDAEGSYRLAFALLSFLVALGGH